MLPTRDGYFENEQFGVFVGPQGQIKVRPGDSLSMYSAAIYDNFHTIHQFGRMMEGGNVRRLGPSDTIYAGETIWHIPTYLHAAAEPAMSISARARAPVGGADAGQQSGRPRGPLGSAGTEQVSSRGSSQSTGVNVSPLRELSDEAKRRATVNALLEMHPELAGKRELITRIVDLKDDLDDIKTVLEYAGLLKKGLSVMSIVDVPLQIMQTLDMIGKADMAAVKFLGHKAYAYGTTAWIFGDPIPARPPEADLEKLRRWISPELRSELAVERWRQMTDAAVYNLSKLHSGMETSKEACQIVLRAGAGDDPKWLARQIYEGFEKHLDPLEVEGHRRLSCDYPH